MSEDDTFRRLKRVSYEALMERLQIRPPHYWALTPPERSNWKNKHIPYIYEECGWTEDEAFEEQKRRYHIYRR